MTNEIVFLSIMLFSMAVALFCFKMGRRWLEAFIVCCMLTLYVVAGKIVYIFGFPVSMGAPIYAAIFLATDMLTEHYGKKVGYRMVRVGFFAAIVYLGFTQLALLSHPAEFAVDITASIEDVVDFSARMIVAGLIAYIIAQHFDVWFYHFIHAKTGGRKLWLRNNLSTATSQFIDTAIFVTIAFYGVVPNLVAFIFISYLAKLFVALCDTPFMYLSRRMTPLDKAEFEVVQKASLREPPQTA